VNNDKKKKETPRLPRRDRGGLVVAPTPRPIETDHPGRKIIREVREARRLAASPSPSENQVPFPLSVLVADSEYGQEIEGAFTAPGEEELFLKSGRPQEEKVDGHQGEVASMLATNEGEVASMLATKLASGRPQEEKVDGHKKDRHRKGRIKYTGRFEPNIFSKIRHFCVDKKLDLQEFFELAAVHFMEQVAVHQEKEVASMLAHDDLLMIWKSTDDIIMRYRAMTGNRWKPADDRAAARFNQTDIRLVEIGMLYTVLRTKAKKINSFAYFIPEIEEVLAVKLADETIDALLKHRRAQWEKLKKEREQKQKG
jgi:hypothetical protein